MLQNCRRMKVLSSQSQTTGHISGRATEGVSRVASHLLIFVGFQWFLLTSVLSTAHGCFMQSSVMINLTLQKEKILPKMVYLLSSSLSLLSLSGGTVRYSGSHPLQYAARREDHLFIRASL